MNFRLWSACAALLFVAACAKDGIHKAAPVTPQQPDTVRVTPPIDNSDNGSSLSDNTHLLLGNPTDAQRNLVFIENYLMDQKYFVESYSKNRGIPVWVGWHLQSEDVGSAGRSDNFRPDPSLPSGWYQVSDKSYNGAVTGFDRGHNCPSGDRTADATANNTTFLMTNMIPQAATLNQGPWEGLEDYVRNTLVSTGNEAYIIMGSYGRGGRGSGQTNFAEILDNGNVTVPQQVWKVVVILPKGNNDLSRVDANTIVLAVNMPNDNSLYSLSGTGKTAWKNYLCTVNDLETKVNASIQAQGLKLDLFKNVPATVRAQLKSKLFQ
ncbi:DNA/RNA non-specific endonuclease [Chitinophaga sp. 30R24]|uniref:DNA/RNA non-specific endonuclease n=1 Tax=Chitinophaga sp. 30R24 TaxID=3248838 RepID=UPI003B91E277